MKNQSGFTLLSMMLALSTLLVIISLAVSITQFMTQRFQPRLDTQKETQIFSLKRQQKFIFPTLSPVRAINAS